MIVNMILATGSDNQLGYKNTIPWFLFDKTPELEYCQPKDMEIFKVATHGSALIAGTSTYNDVQKRISQKSLDETGRTLHRFTRQLYSSPEDMLKTLEEYRSAWIIGGAQTYKAFNHLINGMCVHVMMPYSGPADVYYPQP